MHADINPTEASHYQSARCTGIVSLLLRLIRGHFPRYSLTLGNKSTKALMFANPESCEVGWILYLQLEFKQKDRNSSVLGLT